MLTIESETFNIDAPDETGKYSAGLYKELVGLMASREGKLVKFTTAALGKRVTNDLAILAEHDKNEVFSDKIRGSHHRRIYVRPAKENG